MQKNSQITEVAMPEETAIEVEEEQQIDITELKYQRLLKQVLDFTHRTLKQSSLALQFLQHQGLSNAALLEEFNLGYIDSNFSQSLPSGKEGKEIRQLLKDLGLLSETGRIAFNHYILCPIYDQKQNVINIYARRANRMKSQPTGLWLNQNKDGLFNIKCLAAPEIIVCKSVLDALCLWANGFRNVTVLERPSSFTEYHKELLNEANTEKLFFAYPNDELSKQEAETMAQTAGLPAGLLKLPEDLTVRQYLRQVKRPSDEIQLLISTAETIKATEKPAIEKLSYTPPAQTDLGWYQKGGSYIFKVGDRNYQVSGVEKNLSSDLLKIKIKVSLKSKHYRDNSLDLYTHKIVRRIVKNAAEKLEIEPEIIEKDLDKIISQLEEIQAEIIEKKGQKENQSKSLSPEEIEAALQYLKQPHLMTNIIKDFQKTGLVGEDTNALIGYLTATSRKANKPLAVIIQSSSGAGKTTLMDAILAMMPEDEVVKYSAMTGQSLYYMGEKNLRNKILALVEDEGAEKVSYSLKLLQSEGKISIASAGKDVETGLLSTHEYTVEGPLAIFIATTNVDIDEELRNRCLILTINESREQTQRIHRMQRRQRTLEGYLMKSNSDHLRKLHQNCQKLLRPIVVLNPYADDLTFIDLEHTTRRDHLKYLTLIDTIAFLHQYQREIKTDTDVKGTFEYIDVTLEDIKLAHRLANEVLGISLDELPPQTRRLLNHLYEFTNQECKKRKVDKEDFRFSRREIRDFTGMSNNRLAIHLNRLEEYEYIIKHRGKRGQSFVYELIYEGQGKDGQRFMPGLIEPDQLKLRKRGRK